MTPKYEDCRKILTDLSEWYKGHKGDRNEATTRLHLINKLLESLAWTSDEIEAEEFEDGEYTDYTLSAPRRILVVEAKREGEYFELPAGSHEQVRSIPTLCEDYSDIRKAIKQVAAYCQKRGIPFGAVCNGHQIIAFVAVRLDGVSPLDGKAVVFASIESMVNDFKTLWDLLSKPGIEEQRLRTLLIGEKLTPIPAKLSATIANFPGLKRRNVFQTDLQILSELVLEDIARAPEIEKDFLTECYCESGALSQHSLLAKQILEARYEALFGEDKSAPTVIPATVKRGLSPELFAQSIARRPILLIGDVGVGKTMFIRHLIMVGGATVFENAITIYIDLGSSGILAMDLREFILDDVIRQLRELYSVDIYQRNFVRGIYNLEIQRFSKSIYGDLRQIDQAAYKQREIAFLEQKLNDREKHIKHSLQHIVDGRHKQLVFFLDNTDQRTEPVQEEAFLISQEIAQSWPATVFVTLRPETFHRSLRSGSLSGYHPKAFTISPPRIDAVLEKRLTFGLAIARGKRTLRLTHANIDVKLEALDKIMSSFLDSIKRPNGLIECIDNIAGGNVRVALDLVRQFFGSGHVDTEKIVRTYKESGTYFVPLHEFLRAVIYQDTIYYDQYQSCIINMFDISLPEPREHFILPILVSFLINQAQRTTEKGFVEINRVYDRLQGIGFTPEQVDTAIVRSCRKKIIESGTQEVEDSGQGMPNVLRVTSVGAYHVTRLIRMFTYIDAMITDTPILDADMREKIHDVQDIGDRLTRGDIFIRYLTNQWKNFSTDIPEFDWKNIAAELNEDIARIREQIR